MALNQATVLYLTCKCGFLPSDYRFALQQNKLFDGIKHTDEYGNEYWLARELQVVLQYAKRENFHKVIKTAQIACKISRQSVEDCFPEVRKSIISGKGRESSVIDYKLNRYACYLIVMNGDPRKEVIAVAQTYFAVKTRQSAVRCQKNCRHQTRVFRSSKPSKENK